MNRDMNVEFVELSKYMPNFFSTSSVFSVGIHKGGG